TPSVLPLPYARAASTIFLHCFSVIISVLLTGVSHADLNVTEASRCCAVTGPHGLRGLSFSTVRKTPDNVVLAAADGVAGVPEVWSYATVAGVLQHAHALAVLYLPGDFS